MKNKDLPPWVWGVLAVLVFAWFAYWLGKGN